IWQDPSLASPFDLFTSPSLLPANLPALPPNSNYIGPSYPIYIDPVGASLTSYLGYNAFPLYGYSSQGIRRSTLSFVPNQQSALRWLSILDDVTFNSDGTASQQPILSTSPPQLLRDVHYSWAYLVQRATWNVASPVYVSVVIY